MRTLRLLISIGNGAAEEIEIPIYKDDATRWELNEIALEAFNDLVHFDREAVNE